MTSFYIAQRKRLDIMLNKGKPGEAGGRSTPRTDRHCLRLFQSLPVFPESNVYVNEAKKYVQQNFTHNPEIHHFSFTLLRMMRR